MQYVIGLAACVIERRATPYDYTGQVDKTCCCRIIVDSHNRVRHQCCVDAALLGGPTVGGNMDLMNLLLSGAGGAVLGPLISQVLGGGGSSLVTRIITGIIGGAGAGAGASAAGFDVSAMLGGGDIGAMVGPLLEGGVGGGILATIVGALTKKS